MLVELRAWSLIMLGNVHETGSLTRDLNRLGVLSAAIKATQARTDHEHPKRPNQDCMLRRYRGCRGLKTIHTGFFGVPVNKSYILPLFSHHVGF